MRLSVVPSFIAFWGVLRLAAAMGRRRFPVVTAPLVGLVGAACVHLLVEARLGPCLGSLLSPSVVSLDVPNAASCDRPRASASIGSPHPCP